MGCRPETWVLLVTALPELHLRVRLGTAPLPVQWFFQASRGTSKDP